MDEEPSQEHNWPGEKEHLWSHWMAKTGLPQPTDYRVCLHPECKVSEVRKSPLA